MQDCIQQYRGAHNLSQEMSDTGFYFEKFHLEHLIIILED